MKIRFFFLVCILMSSIDMINAQNLITKKTYWDWGNSRLHETFTVIAGTGTMHGSYKKYNESGALMVSANYNKGALHGLCISYFGTPQKHILKSTNYVNGKKNGIEKTNGLFGDNYYPTEECVYKDDEMIEKTSYYTDAEVKGRKESHVKLVGDKQYNTNWYQSGQIEYDGVFQVTPGNYTNTNTPIQYTKYNETGIVIEKLENKILLVYDDDGKTLKKKDNLSSGIVELYENGSLVKTIKTLKEGEEEVYEVTLYKDNNQYLKVVVDKNGNDIEQRKKQKQLENQYDSLYNVLETIFPLETYSSIQKKEEKARNPQYPKTPYKPFSKSSYESDEKSDFLKTIYRKQAEDLDKIAHQRTEYSSPNSKLVFAKDQATVDKISTYINEIKDQNIVQRYDVLSSIREVISRIENDLYYVECVYTYYRGQQGYKDNVPNIHEKAYYAYISVTQYLSSQVENQSLSNTLAILQQYAIVCSKMKKWEKQKISSIEKLFKKAETPEAQLEIFMNNDIE